MGHSSMINETVYQCPPSILEKCKVGRYLRDLDTGQMTNSKRRNVSSTVTSTSAISSPEKEQSSQVVSGCERPNTNISFSGVQNSGVQNIELPSDANKHRKRPNALISDSLTTTCQEIESSAGVQGLLTAVLR